MIFETNFSKILPRTDNVFSFRFPRPEAFDYSAGQFMYITIEAAGKRLRKHFTISSSPTEYYLEFTKKFTDSDFSSGLKLIHIGDWVKIEGPHGVFILEPEHKKIAMLSGGIGVTPLRSILRYCTDMKLDTDISFLYSNSSEKQIIFKEELKMMSRENKYLRIIHTLTAPDQNWTGETGRINDAMVKRLIPDFMDRLFYICGAPDMVTAMANIMKSIGLPDEKIRRESFPGY